MMKTKARLLTVLAACLPLWAFAGPVDINTADAATISAELKGVGPTKAQAIVEYREKHGPFKSPADLSLVKGIGERTVELNRDNIVVSTPKK
ncbi:MAG: helix-hairpin-helix domain-containing protein [Gammaproteobacteria bacterium]|nr:helix-hairpin-helix domain-containing protein [Gammaproteobacteria bacterium]MDH5305007.1 helix-hairpin-helix domain-containing protein [Gammaproteobacteria bacterium]MDH5321186.1 helix-hairpin-helix domain-containing protein [Gammaproteobacteria bacterium]